MKLNLLKCCSWTLKCGSHCWDPPIICGSEFKWPKFEAILRSWAMPWPWNSIFLPSTHVNVQISFILCAQNFFRPLQHQPVSEHLLYVLYSTEFMIINEEFVYLLKDLESRASFYKNSLFLTHFPLITCCYSFATNGTQSHAHFRNSEACSVLDTVYDTHQLPVSSKLPPEFGAPIAENYNSQTPLQLWFSI